MSRKAAIFVIVFAVSAACWASARPASAALLDNGFRVEGERMLRPGMWKFGGTFAVESNIRPGRETVTNDQVEINILRLPVSWRYGFSPKVEVGVDAQFEQDKGMNFGPSSVFEASGLSYVDMIAKYKMLPWTTFVGRLGVVGGNDLYGGGDGVDLGMDVLLTLPLNLPIGSPNLMHFNTGVRFKNGAPDIDGNKRPDPRGYTTPIYLGWSLIVAPWPRWALLAEVFARRSSFDLEEETEIALGTRYAFTERTTMMASVSHGLANGSPDWAARLGFQTTYGSLTERQVVKTEGRSRIPKEIPEEGPPPLEISVTRLTAIAEASFQRGDYTAAADAFAELVSRLPSEGRIYYNLGVCYYHLKDYARAEGEFLKALTLIQHDSEIYLYLGHCQFLQGRVMDARKSWEECLRLDPTNELAKFLLSSSQ